MTKRSWCVPVLAAMVVGSAALRLLADDASAVGAITGSVVDAQGRAIAGATILFFGVPEQSKRAGDDSGTGKKNGRSVTGVPQRVELAKAILKGKAVSDASGNFEIKTLVAGAYQYRAGNAPTIGLATGEVTVEAGKMVTLPIKLDPPKQ